MASPKTASHSHSTPSTPSSLHNAVADPTVGHALPHSHVLVAGATGATGRLLVAHLAASGVETITALVRDPAKPSAVEIGALTGVQLVTCANIGDADALNAAVDQAVEAAGVPHAFVSCLGVSRIKHTGPKESHSRGEQYVTTVTNVVRAAKRVGAKRFVYMSSGFVTRPWATMARSGCICGCKQQHGSHVDWHQRGGEVLPI